MAADQITQATICQLVDNFYSKVLADADLGPVFVAAIGEPGDKWKPHLNKMYLFWSSLMLGTNLYRGNPFQTHMNIAPFDRSLFDRWLSLFEETAKEIHTDEIVAKYVEKSRNIAKSLQLGLYRD